MADDTLFNYYDSNAQIQEDLLAEDALSEGSSFSGSEAASLPLAESIAEQYNNAAGLYQTRAEDQRALYQQLDPAAALSSQESGSLLFSALIPVLAGALGGDTRLGVQAGLGSGQSYLGSLLKERAQKREDAKEDIKLLEKNKADAVSKANDLMFKSLSKKEEREQDLEDFKLKRDIINKGRGGSERDLRLPPKEAEDLQKKFNDKLEKTSPSLRDIRSAYQAIREAEKAGVLKEGDDFGNTFDNITEFLKAKYYPNSNISEVRRQFQGVILAATKAVSGAQASNLDLKKNEERTGFQAGTNTKILKDFLKNSEKKLYEELASADYRIRMYGDPSSPYINPTPWRNDPDLFLRDSEEPKVQLEGASPEKSEILLKMFQDQKIRKGQSGIRWIPATDKKGKAFEQKVEFDYTDPFNPKIYYLSEY